MAFVTVSASRNPVIDGLLYGTKWTDQTVSYSLPDTADELTDYSEPLDPLNFRSLDASERLLVQTVLASWSSVADIRFTEAPNAGGTIRLYHYDDMSNLTARSLGWPSGAAEAGDVQLGALLDDANGNYGGWSTFTLVHELGHALGLKHPHDELNGFPSAEATEDSILTTVMSYRSYPGAPLSGYSVADGSYPFGPMIDDIAAIQYLYGASWTTNNGDSTYTFDPTAAVLLGAFWDAGGNDTYNFFSYSTDLSIDLRPGQWIDLGGQYAVLDPLDAPRLAPANLGIPYLYQDDPRSLIENATAGSGQDRVTGNQADNILKGGGGDDTLWGLEGNDTLAGESGCDELYGGDGDDLLKGGTNDDQLEGDDGGDDLQGDDGNDILNGGTGNDRLSGGNGNDQLSGGEGADIFVLPPFETGSDIITDFSQGDRIKLAGGAFDTPLSRGDGSLVLAGETQLSVNNGVTTLYVGLDGLGGADLQVKLTGVYDTHHFELEGGDLVYQIPAPPRPSIPQPVVNTTVQDGIKVTATLVRNTDGSQTQTVAIPLVPQTRLDNSGNPATADLVLYKDAAGAPLLSVALPTGIGLQAVGVSGMTDSQIAKSHLSSLADTLVLSVAEHSTLLDKLTVLVDQQPAHTPMTAHVISLTSDGATPLAPITIQADPASLLLIDSQGLPPTASITLQGGLGALIIGSSTVRVTTDVALYGDDGAQTFIVEAADLVLDAGGGSDRVVFVEGVRSDFSIRAANGGLTMQARDDSGPAAQLLGVETLRFGADEIELTQSEIGSIVRLYSSAFGRNPDTDGINFWIGAVENGMSLTDVATGFVNSSEYQAVQGSVDENAALVDALYTNALGRPADEEGRAWHIALLENGGTAGQLLLEFANSAEKVALTGTIDSSIDMIA